MKSFKAAHKLSITQIIKHTVKNTGDQIQKAKPMI